MANSEDRKDSVIMDEIDEKERSGQTEQSEQTKQAEQGDECADQTTEQTEKPAGQETPEGGLRIQLDAMRAMSLPLLTAGYPLIRQIVLENQGKAAVTGLRLRVVSPEGFFQPWERDLPAIPADTALPAEIPALVFDAQKMAERQPDSSGRRSSPAAREIKGTKLSGRRVHPAMRMSQGTELRGWRVYPAIRMAQGPELSGRSLLSAEQGMQKQQTKKCSAPRRRR